MSCKQVGKDLYVTDHVNTLTAPEILKALGLKGGGRAEFATGGGIAVEDVDSMRKRAVELLCGVLSEEK